MFPWMVRVQHVAFLSMCIQLYSFSSQDSSKLLFVQILFRHGDRSPIEIYPSSKNNASTWQEGLGELTVLGKKQHYELGKYLHKRYQHFTSFNPYEIAVFSAESNRCMLSAATNVASFFAPESGSSWVIDEDFNWQPIAIRYIPKKLDKYLEIGSVCPKSDEELTKCFKSSLAKQIEEEHKAMFEKLSKVTGKKVESLADAGKVYDTIAIEKKYNLSIPSSVESHLAKLDNLTNWCVFLGCNSTLIQKLRAGPLLKKIITTMNKTIEGKLKQRKFQIYSSHDANVAVVLAALKQFNFRMPPYCATLLFELHEMQDEGKSVRLLYLNSTKPEEKVEEPHTLVLEGCKEFCPFSQFAKFVKHVIPKNWKKECKKSHKSGDKKREKEHKQRKKEHKQRKKEHKQRKKEHKKRKKERKKRKKEHT